MYLVYDTSTAGKPSNWKADPTDTFSWPRMVQLSWILFDENYKKLENGNHLIKPEGFTMDRASEKYYGVTQEILENEGEDLSSVLKTFSEVVDKAEVIFSFNQKFNESVVLAEFFRKKMPQRLQASESYCIMQESTYFCKLQGRGGKLRWPSLQELHYAVFGKEYDHANNAIYDCIAAAKSLFVLMEAGQIDVE